MIWFGLLPDQPPPRAASRWAGLSQTSRRTQRRTLLLDTAFDLLAAEGWTGLSVRRVCQVARLNPRYFYESFANLDELLVAVYDKVVDDLGTAVTAAVADAPPDVASQIRVVIDTILDFVDADRRRGHILYVVALGNETLNRRRRETGLHIVDLVEQDARSRAGIPTDDHVSRMGAAILVGGFAELLTEWLAGQIKVDRERLAADATAMFLALGDAGSRIVADRRRSEKPGRR